jgi:epoxyqueuosine reductase
MSDPVHGASLKKWQDEYGFDLLSWIPLPRPLTFSFYSNWLEEQRHGDMAYLKAQSTLKEDPRHVFEQGKSLIVAGVRYKPHPEPLEPFPDSLRIAAYAKGRDYHLWLAEKLNKLAESIKSQNPTFEYMIATDSKPFLERDLAQQAALGWIGKNTCLIHPKEGSFFFLAEILTNLEITGPDLEPIPDFCGKCTRCLDACPTGALESPRLLDARKCISYWTIESKEVPPQELREKMGDWFFGCDICQDVCPWNEKVFRKRASPQTAPSEATLSEELRFFLTASNREMERQWGHTPLLRARPRGLRRNAILVAANKGLRELRPEIERWKEDAELGELARWALERL